MAERMLSAVISLIMMVFMIQILMQVLEQMQQAFAAITPAPEEVPAEHYDDFSGTELDTTKWEWILGSGTASYTVSGGMLNLSASGGGSYGDVFSLSLFSPTKTIRGRMKFNSGDGDVVLAIRLDPDNEVSIYLREGTSVQTGAKIGGTWQTEQTLGSISPGQFYILELEYQSEKVTARAKKDDGTLIGEYTWSVSFAQIKIRIGATVPLGKTSVSGSVDWIDVV